MTSPDDDDALLAQLRALFAHGAEPPDEVLHAGRELFAWRDVDTELAALTFDSLLDHDALTRADGGPRMLVFTVGRHGVDVEVVDDTRGRRLLGQLNPPGAAEVQLRSATEVVDGFADDLGRFVLPLAPAPALSTLRWSRTDGAKFASSAVVM